MRKEAVLGRGTHLTVYLTRRVKANHVDDYGQESGHAREGVDLL